MPAPARGPPLRPLRARQPPAGEDQRLKLPRFLEDEAAKDPEATKQDLIDKIAQLNASIDEVASQLRSKESPAAATESAETMTVS